MRVLHVHDRAGFRGGVEQIMHDLADGLGARGWPQALLCREHAGDAKFDAAFARVCTHVADAAEFRPDVVVLHKWSDARLVESLLARHPTLQVAHDHDLYCPRRHKYFPLNHQACGERAGGACLRHLCLVERRDGLIPIGFTSLPEFRRRMAVARRAGLLVAGSRYSADQLAHNGYPADRIVVIPPVPAAIGRATYLQPGETGRMLFVGQVIRGKGLDLLLDAAARLQGEWRLDVVGEGRQLQECRQQAVRLGIADRVHFAGWVPHTELDEWYRRASFTVVPSRWPEPFGMIGLESMSRGRPVVAFDSGGIRDWLAHEVSGLLVRPGDVDALRHALQQAISTPGLVRRLGYHGARHCLRRFDHGSYLDAMQGALVRAAGCEEIPATGAPSPFRVAFCKAPVARQAVAGA
jgi:glycosyltransferase involved in cell wall biosynthesis